MEGDRGKPDSDGRRAFLKGAGATVAFAGASAAPTRGIAQTSAQNLQDRKSTRLNSSHIQKSRMPSSA